LRATRQAGKTEKNTNSKLFLNFGFNFDLLLKVHYSYFTFPFFVFFVWLVWLKLRLMMKKEEEVGGGVVQVLLSERSG
jgi:hypothetical protein